MNKDNLRLWVDALRSGEYEQTQGMLARKQGEQTSYCCLGVACEVAAANGVIIPKTVDSYPTMDEFDKVGGGYAVNYGCPSPDGEFWGDSTSGTLPPHVSEWLTGEYGYNEGNMWVLVDEDGNSETLTTLNDRFRWTFEQIADAIEKTYLT